MRDIFDSTPLFLTARQLAERLGLSIGQVRALVQAGRIPEITIGRNTRRYDLEAVVAALTTTDRTSHAGKETPHAE